MGLMKSTNGLPKFTAACGFWRHPRWVGASLDEIGLHLAGISYCYEHGTDGALPARESLAAALGLRERQVTPALARLCADGRWHDCATHIVIDGYLDHNPSSDEIRESKERRRAAGKKAADKRWASESHSEAQTSSYDAQHANERNYVRNADESQLASVSWLQEDEALQQPDVEEELITYSEWQARTAGAT